MSGRARWTTSGTQSAAEATARAEGAHAPWTELEEHLENAKRSILAEIRHYPPPIAACDQQFNHLLEQRDRIADELSRLASIRRLGSTGEGELKALIDFIRTSDCIAPELKAHLVRLFDGCEASRASSPAHPAERLLQCESE
jgi:hypothetical protein